MKGISRFESKIALLWQSNNARHSKMTFICLFIFEQLKKCTWHKLRKTLLLREFFLYLESPKEDKIRPDSISSHPHNGPVFLPPAGKLQLRKTVSLILKQMVNRNEIAKQKLSTDIKRPEHIYQDGENYD